MLGIPNLGILVGAGEYHELVAQIPAGYECKRQVIRLWNRLSWLSWEHICHTMVAMETISLLFCFLSCTLSKVMVSMGVEQSMNYLSLKRLNSHQNNLFEWSASLEYISRKATADWRSFISDQLSRALISVANCCISLLATSAHSSNMMTLYPGTTAPW